MPMTESEVVTEPAFLSEGVGGGADRQRLSPVDAQQYWGSAKIPSDQFLLYVFAGEPGNVGAAVTEVLRRAQSSADLRLRVDDTSLVGYPAWVRGDVDASQVIVRIRRDLFWQQCLDEVAKLMEHQLDLSRMAWQLHVFTSVYGAPRCAGPATIAVLQVGHALADGRRAAMLAGWLFGRGETAPPVNPPRRQLLSSASAVARMRWQLHRDTAAGSVPPPARLRPALSTNNCPAGGCALRTLVRHRSDLPGPTVTVGVLAAVSAALSGYLSARGEDASQLGAEVPMYKSSLPHSRNHFEIVGVGLHPHVTVFADRAALIAVELADRRRRIQHPAFSARDRAFAAVPALLLKWRVSRFDLDERPPMVIGNTVVTSVNRGRADLSFGGCPVVFTADSPGTAPMMGLIHGVRGIGDVVAVTVCAAKSAVADVDDYLHRLETALGQGMS